MSDAGIILDTVGDLVVAFLHDDRKEDEELPLGAIQNAVKKGEISIDDITLFFKGRLIKALEDG